MQFANFSPAYDITYAYNPDGMWTGAHQMTVNGKRRDIFRPDLLATAGNMGIKKADAEQIISEIQACMEKWMNYAEIAEIRESIAEKIQRAFITF